MPNRLKTQIYKPKIEDNSKEAEDKYLLDLTDSIRSNRSLSFIVNNRRCRECQRDEPNSVPQTSDIKKDIKKYIQQISRHCSNEVGYLNPKTTLKEAITRALMAMRNKPSTTVEICQWLIKKWNFSAFPRDISPKTIQRFLQAEGSIFLKYVSGEKRTTRK
jgi:hypothetical protein